MVSRFALCACLLVVLVGCGFAIRDVSPTVNANALIASQHNHRGMVQNEEWVFVPDLSARLTPVRAYPSDEGGTVRLQAKGFLNLTDDTGEAWFPDGQGGKFSEVDLKADYSRSFEIVDWPVDAGAGVLTYVLPNGSAFPNGPRGTTTELFANVGTPVFAGEIYSFYPHFTTHYDPDEADGFYFKGGVAKGVGIRPALDRLGIAPPGDLSRRIVESLSFQVNLAVGYSSSDQAFWDYGLDKGGFSDFTGTGTLLCRFFERTTISVGVGGSTIIDEDLDEWFDLIGIDSDNVWVRFGVGWEFGGESS